MIIFDIDGTLAETDDYYVGDQQRKLIDQEQFRINDKKVILFSTTNDSLVVVAEGLLVGQHIDPNPVVEVRLALAHPRLVVALNCAHVVLGHVGAVVNCSEVIGVTGLEIQLARDESNLGVEVGQILVDVVHAVLIVGRGHRIVEVVGEANRFG